MVAVRRAGERAIEQVHSLNFPPVAKEVIHAQAFCITMGSQGKGRLRFGKKSAVEITMEADSIVLAWCISYLKLPHLRYLLR